MADVGLNPPYNTKQHCKSGVMKDALAQFGSIVVSSGTSGHADMITSTSLGDPLIEGVVVSQGDPNNSGLFAQGDLVSVCDLGIIPVLLLGSTTYARGDRIIQSSTAGVGKKIASETGDLGLVGICEQDVTTGTNPQLVAVRVLCTRIKL